MIFSRHIPPMCHTHHLFARTYFIPLKDISYIFVENVISIPVHDFDQLLFLFYSKCTINCTPKNDTLTNTIVKHFEKANPTKT